MKHYFFSSESSRPPAFWILPKLYELCEFCRINLIWSVFSWTRTEYGDLLRKSSYSARVRENTGQKKLRIWTLFTLCVDYVINPKRTAILKTDIMYLEMSSRRYTGDSNYRMFWAKRFHSRFLGAKFYTHL